MEKTNKPTNDLKAVWWLDLGRCQGGIALVRAADNKAEIYVLMTPDEMIKVASELIRSALEIQERTNI